jgi:hypothetical protein
MTGLSQKSTDKFFILTLTSEGDKITPKKNLEVPPNITVSKGKCAACAICLVCWFSAAAWTLTAAGTVAK